MPLTDLDWLRRLLEDQPTRETEAITGNGVDREFTVSNPPILLDTLIVTLNGSPQTEGLHFTEPDTQTILFATPPPDGAHVVFTYTRTLFGTIELEHYLAIGSEDHDRQIERVYRAALLAIDSLLIGSATALKFGAGAEDFDMPSVFERLATLRAQLAAALAQETRRPLVFEPAEPVDLLFPPP